MTVARRKPEKVWGFTVASFFGLIGVFVAIWPLGLYGTAEFWPAILVALAAALILWAIQRLVLWIFIIVGFITM